MKNSKIFYLFAFLTLSALPSSEVLAQPGISVSFQTFYNELSPYGRWGANQQYGSVWYPNVGRDFQPYGTNGQWVMTEYGNTWVSDYDWGWAPFHYGRWFYDDFNGWAWVPDSQWGPAWVDWRSGGDYYGWAPLFPGMRIGINVNIPGNFWVFVPRRYINRRAVFGYCVPRTRVVNIYNRTTVINNYYRNDNRVYAYGPRQNEIERATRSSVPVYRADEIRGSRGASGRQSADGSYMANGNSNSGMSRQSRDNTSGARTNASGRVYDTQSATGRTYDSGTSGRTYDAGSSNRARGGYEKGSVQSTPRGYESPHTSGGRTYESAEPSSRARSNSQGSRYEAPQSQSGSRASRGDYSTGRSRASGGASSSSQYSGRSSAESRASAPAVRSQGSDRSSSGRSSGSNSNSREGGSSNRSRGPR